MARTAPTAASRSAATASAGLPRAESRTAPMTAPPLMPKLKAPTNNDEAASGAGPAWAKIMACNGTAMDSAAAPRTATAPTDSTVSPSPGGNRGSVARTPRAASRTATTATKLARGHRS